MHLRRFEVDQRDLQGNVLCGYGNAFRHARYVFVRIVDARAGRCWLRELADQVTDAVPWRKAHKPQLTLNVALSNGGLRAIGVPAAILASFPGEFRDGMSASAESLGDTGESAPSNWEPELAGVHVLISVMAQDEDVVKRGVDALRERVASTEGALEIAYEQEAELLGHPDEELGRYGREHFGFADGFSQPAIRGNAGPSTRKGMGTPLRLGRWRSLAPGEFVLGYPGEDGLPPAAPAAPLGRSGTFMVWRKLEQDVPRFRTYLRQAAQRELSRGSEGVVSANESERRDQQLAERQQALAAKMVGRWSDGRSLVVSQNPHPEGKKEKKARHPKRINRFRYGRDPHGLACPLGAHVRRANPRDALGWQGRPTKLHRIIRRGMPYGPALPDGELEDSEDAEALRDASRGLIFICYQASIAHQFELIQTRWLNDGDPFWLGSERDLLVGGEPREGGAQAPDLEDEPAAAKMTIQGTPPRFLTPRRAFVTTRGGEYFFVPGLAALRALASAYWR